MRHSKTDQLGKGRIISIAKIYDSSICACHFMYKYCSIRPKCGSHLFVHVDGLPLTRFQFSAVLKKCLVKLNLDHLHITTHSFRIGAATEASRLGLSASAIQDLGGRKSNCFKTYIRPNLCHF